MTHFVAELVEARPANSSAKKNMQGPTPKP